MLLRPFDFFVYFLFFFLWFFYFILFYYFFVQRRPKSSFAAIRIVNSVLWTLHLQSWSCFSCTLDLIVLHILVWAKCIFESVWCLLSDGCRVHHEKKRIWICQEVFFSLSLLACFFQNRRVCDLRHTPSTMRFRSALYCKQGSERHGSLCPCISPWMPAQGLWIAQKSNCGVMGTACPVQPVSHTWRLSSEHPHCHIAF